MESITPYGTWDSPVSAADTVAGVVRFSDIRYDGGMLYWLEGRPAEGGRSVLVRRSPDGVIDEPLADEINVRSMVHEYGGGAYAGGHGGVVYSHFDDQRLRGLEAAEPLTASPEIDRGVRFADMEIEADGSVICVRETHHGDAEATNEIVRIDGDGGEEVLVSGSDFYASPRVSRDGSMLAWVEWDHPNMPWDDTRLVVAPLASIQERTVVAGGGDESTIQPEWDDDGSLVFISDRTGWWNLYRWRTGRVEAVTAVEADLADPPWVFGLRSYTIMGDGTIVVAWHHDGDQTLAAVRRDGALDVINDRYSWYRYLTAGADGTVWFVGSGPDAPDAVVGIDIATGSETIAAANAPVVDDAYVPRPKLISFPTTWGERAHAVYYPPRNPNFEGPTGERPPLIVHIHGGPTSQAHPEYKASTVFWTTRGFGVVDVNHRGSTGFGRSFRERLRGNWGTVDVDDAVAAARFLSRRGEVDGERLVISGGSAGGYTTLAALAFRDGFAAGTSYFGVADLELLAAETHKFESRYLDGLCGPREEWAARSPINSVDDIVVPVALFQGLDDPVVPPVQTTMIAEALGRNGVPHIHVEYEGEAHGFRGASTIIDSLLRELAFYGAVFGFAPAGDIPHLDLSAS